MSTYCKLTSVVGLLVATFVAMTVHFRMPKAVEVRRHLEFIGRVSIDIFANFAYETRVAYRADLEEPLVRCFNFADELDRVLTQVPPQREFVLDGVVKRLPLHLARFVLDFRFPELEVRRHGADDRHQD